MIELRQGALLGHDLRMGRAAALALVLLAALLIGLALAVLAITGAAGIGINGPGAPDLLPGSLM